MGIGGLGETCGTWEDLGATGVGLRDLVGQGEAGDLGGRAELCHGRFEPDPHLFVEVERAWGTPEICPTAWISALGRPSKKSEGRKSKFQIFCSDLLNFFLGSLRRSKGVSNIMTPGKSAMEN